MTYTEEAVAGLLQSPAEVGGKGAIFSLCRTYRYALHRRTFQGEGMVLFVGLNPSTADERTDDPTIRRCIRFAADWGFSRLAMANLFAFRSTDPRALSKELDPVGEANDGFLVELARNAGMVVAAWGARGGLLNRDAAVMELLADREVHCLGTTQSGAPRHPLYLSVATGRIRYRAGGSSPPAECERG